MTRKRWFALTSATRVWHFARGHNECLLSYIDEMSNSEIFSYEISDLSMAFRDHQLHAAASGKTHVKEWPVRVRTCTSNWRNLFFCQEVLPNIVCTWSHRQLRNDWFTGWGCVTLKDWEMRSFRRELLHLSVVWYLGPMLIESDCPQVQKSRERSLSTKSAIIIIQGQFSILFLTWFNQRRTANSFKYSSSCFWFLLLRDREREREYC